MKLILTLLTAWCSAMPVAIADSRHDDRSDLRDALLAREFLGLSAPINPDRCDRRDRRDCDRDWDRDRDRDRDRGDRRDDRGRRRPIDRDRDRDRDRGRGRGVNMWTCFYEGYDRYDGRMMFKAHDYDRYWADIAARDRCLSVTRDCVYRGCNYQR